MKKIITLLLFAGSIIPVTSSAQNNILNLDGVNDYVSTGITESATTFANWTIECWVKSPNVPSTSNFTGPVYGNSMGIIWNHSNPSFAGAACVQSATGTFYSASFGSLLGSTWYHLAATYNGTSLKTYKNGSLVSTTATNGGITGNTNMLSFGKHPSLSNFFAGEMDEVRIWTTARTVSEIASNMNNELLGNESGLYAYYNFNQGIPNGDNTSISNLSDQTPNAHNGTFTNFTLNGNVSNLISGSPLVLEGLNFDGANDFVSTPIVVSNTTFANWTLECWVKSPAAPTSGSFTGPIYHDNMGIIWNHSNGAFQGAASVQSAVGTFYSSSFGTLLPNSWYHLAATYDGISLKSYKNGVLQIATATNGGMANSTTTLQLGKHPTLANYFNCTMDEVRIWNVARTCSEINSTMNAELLGTETSLLAYYDFNDGSPNVVNSLSPLIDKTNNANNGTLTNFSLTGTASNFVIGSSRNAALNPSCPFTPVGLTTINSIDSKFSVYPNPASNVLFVTIESGLEISADIYSIEGKLIKSVTLSESQNQIDINDLDHGFYTLMIKSGRETSCAKFIKE